MENDTMKGERPVRRLSQKENEGAVMQQELERITRVIGEGPYRDDWESLAGMEMPAWFGREKFGIFIHWGLYSIPAHNNEWYSRNMYIRNKEEWEYHRRTYGIWLQGFHSVVSGGKILPGRVGGAYQSVRRALRISGGGAPRRLSDVQKPYFLLECV